jgi:hypothetical protein
MPLVEEAVISPIYVFALHLEVQLVVHTSHPTRSMSMNPNPSHNQFFWYTLNLGKVAHLASGGGWKAFGVWR